jgi:hypothetical protein
MPVNRINKQGFIEVVSPRKPFPKTPNPWAGGIFGQPPSPAGRAGIFISRWPMGPDQRHEDSGVFNSQGQLIKNSAEYASGPGISGLSDVTYSDQLAKSERNAWIRFGILAFLIVSYLGKKK